MTKISLKELYKKLNPSYEEFNNLTSYEKQAYFEKSTAKQEINIFNFSRIYKSILVSELRDIEDINVFEASKLKESVGLNWFEPKKDFSNMNPYDVIVVHLKDSGNLKYWFSIYRKEELRNVQFDSIHKKSLSEGDALQINYFYKDFKDFKSYKKGDTLKINATFSKPGLPDADGGTDRLPVFYDNNYLKSQQLYRNENKEKNKKTKKRDNLILIAFLLIILTVIVSKCI
jgi:hypothetical protein